MAPVPKEPNGVREEPKDSVDWPVVAGVEEVRAALPKILKPVVVVVMVEGVACATFKGAWPKVEPAGTLVVVVAVVTVGFPNPKTGPVDAKPVSVLGTELEGAPKRKG